MNQGEGSLWKSGVETRPERMKKKELCTLSKSDSWPIRVKEGIRRVVFVGRQQAFDDRSP
jgi:hypothetical protein